MRSRPKKSSLFIAFCMLWGFGAFHTSSSALTASTGIAGGREKSLGKIAGPASSLRAGGILLQADNGSDSSETMKTRKKTAVVVGGGPGGLAAALVLSQVKKPGNVGDSFFERIIVLEDRPKESYDPSRAYGFGISQRGQRFTNAFNIDLSKRGVGRTGFSFKEVPADPNVVYDPEPQEGLMPGYKVQKKAASYSIPRHELMEQIEDEIHASNKKAKKNGNPIIELRRGNRCEYIEPTEDGLVKIVVANNKEPIITDLCVGADGISSNVRRSLEDGRFDPEQWSNAKNPSKKFGLKKRKSPSTGLRVKGLKVDSNFAIPKGGTGPDSKTEFPFESRHTFYRLDSATKEPTDSLPLGILAQKSPISVRVLTICTQPDHDLWNPEKIRTDDGGRSAKAFFEKAHPRYDWDKLVTAEEWKTFASAKGLKFPPCQYVPSMYISSNPSSSDDMDGAGVVLLGDALHAFPPDLGLGVNTAFCDAMLLGKSFEEAATTVASTTTSRTSTSTNSFVTRALKSYQEKNGPETRALVTLCRVGRPFQYGQKWMKFQKILWTANVGMRVLLNKLTLGLSPKPAVLLMVENPDMSFHQIMKKANRLTKFLWSSFLLATLSLIWTRIKLNWILM